MLIHWVRSWTRWRPVFSQPLIWPLAISIVLQALHKHFSDLNKITRLLYLHSEIPSWIPTRCSNKWFCVRFKKAEKASKTLCPSSFRWLSRARVCCSGVDSCLTWFQCSHCIALSDRRKSSAGGTSKCPTSRCSARAIASLWRWYVPKWAYQFAVRKHRIPPKQIVGC